MIICLEGLSLCRMCLASNAKQVHGAFYFSTTFCMQQEEVLCQTLKKHKPTQV